MNIEFIKTSGVTLFGAPVWDGYTATVDGKDYKQIRKVGGKWHVTSDGSSLSLVCKTLKEAKSQIRREVEKFGV